MRFHFMINPRAGRARSYGKLTAAIRAEFRGWDIRFSSLPPVGSPEGGSEVIVAVGGDGTVSRVLNSTVGNGLPLGILPCGTSNDLASALGIPRHFTPACNILKQASQTTIDLVSMNDSYFATCGGIGLPAAVAARVNRWRQGKLLSRLAARLGRGIYPLAALRELGCKNRSVWAAIHTPDSACMAHWTAVMVSNQPRIGGFSVAPESSNRDGWLDLCAIRAPDQSFRLLDIMHKAWRGRPADCPEMSSSLVQAVTLVTNRAVPFMADGELLEYGTRFRVSVAPKALRVIVPRPADTIVESTRHLPAACRPEIRERRCG